MATTLTTKVAQAVKKATGKGTTIFNDRLVDGARSLKVWGWKREDYIMAKQMLEQAGAKAEIVEFMSDMGWRCGKRLQLRLHVVE